MWLAMPRLDLTKPTALRLHCRVKTKLSEPALTILNFPEPTEPALPCLDWTHRTQPETKTDSLGNRVVRDNHSADILRKLVVHQQTLEPHDATPTIRKKHEL